MERLIAVGRVFLAGCVAEERFIARGSVGEAGVVKDKRVSSKGSVQCTSGVEQKRRYTNGRVVVRGVEVEGSSTNRRVETAGAVAKERIPADCCISSPCGEGIKRFASFSCREIRIASVRSRTDCRRFWQERNAENKDQDGD